MLKHTKGDLLALAQSGKFDVIVQGCNCFNTMGSGIAKQIREQYPQAALIDCQTARGDYNKLGNYTVARANVAGFDIVNAYTQYGYNRKGEAPCDRFEYTAFELILQKLLREYAVCDFGFPYIGMGLAGGDQRRIIGLLEWFADSIENTGGSATLVEYA